MDGGTIFGVLLIIIIIVLLAITKVRGYMSQLTPKKDRLEEESLPLDCAEREPWENHGKLVNGRCPKCGKSFIGPGRKLPN